MYARTTASGVRSSWVTRAMSSARARSSATSCSTCASASAWRRPFSTMPASRSAIADSWAMSPSPNSRWVSVWTLSTPTTWSRHVEGDGEHRVDEPALVDAADPQEAVVLAHVGDDDRLAHRGHATGDPLPERHDGAADLVAVEAVRRGESEVEPVAVEEVSDVTSARSASRVPSTTVSRSSSHVRAVVARRRNSWRRRSCAARRRRVGGGRGQLVRRTAAPEVEAASDAAARTLRTRSSERRHGEHDTSLEASATSNGCGGVPARCPCSRTVTVGCWHVHARSAILTPWPRTSARSRRASESDARARGSRPSPPSRRGPGSAARATRWRARSGCSARCSARSSRSRPGPSMFELVERIRRRTIALRRGDPELVSEPDAERARLGARRSPSLDLDQRGRGRQGVHALLPARQPRRGAAAHPRAADSRPQRPWRPDRRLHRPRHRPPAADPRPRRGPGAGRRACSSTPCSPPIPPRPDAARCSWRCAGSDACWTSSTTRSTTPDEDADLRRRLREEITLLWHTGGVRSVMPTPLDEVRSELAIFDETLFTVVPRFQRAIDRALDAAGRGHAAVGSRRPGIPPRTPPMPGRTGTHPVAAPAAAPVRVVDRRGPRRPPGRHERHHAPRRSPPGRPPAARLRGGRAAADADGRRARGARRAWTGRSVTRSPRTREELPETMRQLRRRFPEEPYRQRLGAIAERVRRTRAALTGETAPRTGGYPTPARSTRSSPSSSTRSPRTGSARVAYGELADLRWQLATFGFHLASLEVRQHAAVHRAAIAALDAGAGPDEEVAGGVTLGEVLATFRTIARLQARLGVAACQRYVISFTTRPDDVTTVLELARRAAEPEPFGRPVPVLADLPAAAPVLDVVPLLESADALSRRRRAPRPAVRRPRLPGASPGPRRHPGGDAGLLGLVQGERVPRGELAPVPRPGGARRGGTASRDHAHAVPRPRRRDRSRRRPGEPRDPRPGAGLGERPPQVHRAGRGHRRPLRRRDDRPAPPRAGHRRGAARLPTGARAGGARGRGRRRRTR